MLITTKINMDMRRPVWRGAVHAVQNDSNTRAVELHLLDDGFVWPIPSGVTAAVGYKKPDGTNGLYDKLPDGTDALTISGSAVTAILAQQMLTVPGSVSMSLILYDADLHQLATFPVVLFVEPNPAAEAVKSEDYTNASSILATLGLTPEDWVFTLEDGSTVTKKVVIAE